MSAMHRFLQHAHVSQTIGLHVAIATQVPCQLRLSADLESSMKEKMDMLTNQRRYRELCFMLPDLTTGKGKLKALKKAWPSVLDSSRVIVAFCSLPFQAF